MKSRFLILCLFTFIGTGYALGQTGRVIEREQLKSKILSADMYYSVYLPADYFFSSRNYPVLYLLHGFTDDDSAWLQYGRVSSAVDNFINSGKSPFIIIMPDAGRSYYINAYHNKLNYETYFIKEFLPLIEKKYRIRADRRFRGIAGLSMGGYGAMLYGLKYPDIFSVAMPLSAAIRTDEQIKEMDNERYEGLGSTPVFGPGLNGNERLNETWVANSVIRLINQRPLEELMRVKWYIDCGDDDALLHGNIAAHQALKKRGVPHEFRVRDGGHEWSYWRSALPGVFNYLDKNFSK